MFFSGEYENILRTSIVSRENIGNADAEGNNKIVLKC